MVPRVCIRACMIAVRTPLDWSFIVPQKFDLPSYRCRRCWPITSRSAQARPSGDRQAVEDVEPALDGIGELRRSSSAFPRPIPCKTGFAEVAQRLLHLLPVDRLADDHVVAEIGRRSCIPSRRSAGPGWPSVSYMMPSSLVPFSRIVSSICLMCGQILLRPSPGCAPTPPPAAGPARR